MPEKKPLSDVVSDLFKVLDTQAESVTKRAGVSCRKGCNHCCYLLTLVTQVEAIYMAEYLLQSEEMINKLPKLLNELRAAALAVDYNGITKQSYFDKNVKCPFLESGECSIYSHRPSPCRYHYVISPAENCSNTSKVKETSILNLIPLEMEVWKLDELVTKSPIPISAPIPIVVLWALKTIIDMSDTEDETGKLLKEAIYVACKDIKNPTQWTIAHHQSLIQDDRPMLEEFLPFKEP